MTDSQYGNGKKLAESLKEIFSPHEVKIADVKEVNPTAIAEDIPDVLILGGAVRAFMGDKKSFKWLKELNELLERSGNKIKFGTGFLTHAMPTKRIQGYAKKHLAKLEKASMIDKIYTELLTARVESAKGPISLEHMDNAKRYAQDFMKWLG